MRIISSHIEPHGRNCIRVYRTTDGVFTSIELARYLGIEKNVLFQRINKYGLTDSRVINAPWPGRPSKRRTGKPNWSNI